MTHLKEYKSISIEKAIFHFLASRNPFVWFVQQKQAL
jgi:hypothetical protein